MPKFQARAGVEVEAEIATGKRTAQTPQGVVVAQPGDALVRIGGQEAVIAGPLWAAWFEPWQEKPAAEAKSLDEMTKAELVDHAEESFGVTLSASQTKSQLVADIERLSEEPVT